MHTPEIRSKNMSAIRGRDTKPELTVRKALHSKGFRYRLNVRSLPGTPDIVLPKHRAVIFVHGCFWHGHSCPLFKVPKTRTQFWLDKIGRNVKRDTVNQEKLLASGWRIAVIWECVLKGPYREGHDKVIGKLTRWLTSPDETVLELEGLYTP